MARPKGRDLAGLERKVRHRIDREERWLVKIPNLGLLARP